MKGIDLTKSVHELATTIPEFLDMMETLGFDGMRHCVEENPHTKVMTPLMAAANHGVEPSMIVKAFQDAGFTVINQ
ncbi:hypothetical protein [Solobacterium moorei]|uniref:hypothetical protein n=1 Tax=Solobacterium moorei TaxID=102148 RepID=UPI00041D541F|nr:hypothetical protein [Solobacterium moorei]BET21758.1 hypothetical protein RGT18_13460 [Solobacterium moorei]